MYEEKVDILPARINSRTKRVACKREDCYIGEASRGEVKNHSAHYIVFYKPYGVLSQFTREAGHRSLADYGPFPPGTYPVGRLDADSEGLLMLTNDNEVKRKLTDPGFRHDKTYLVQVERTPDEASLERFREGIPLGSKRTLPARIRVLDPEPTLPPRSAPIRFRKSVPTSWLEVIVVEGRNRQVRRMTAAIGHPTLRLVRTRITFLSLRGLLPGQCRALTPEEVSQLKRLVADKR